MPFATAAAIVGGTALVSGYLGAKASGRAAQQSSDATQRGIDEQARQFDITQEQYKPFREAGLRGLNKYESMLNSGYVNGGPPPSRTLLGGIRPSGEALSSAGIFGGKVLARSAGTKVGSGPAIRWSENMPSSFSYTAEDFNKGKDPGYEFRRSEGLRALDRVKARRGELMSGSRYRGLMELGQNLASQEFGAARNRAFQDYQTQVAREQEQYQRGYVDPMNRYAGLAGIGQSATSGLAGMRSNYASNVANLYGQQGQAQAAGTLGAAGAWTGAIQSGMGLYGMLSYGGFGGGGGTAGAASAPGGGNLYSMQQKYGDNALTRPMQFSSGTY